MSILNALRGIGGDFEIQRILGAFGTVMYVISAPAFVWAGKVQTTLEGFCIQYPIGLAACVGATAGAIALKDRQVAKAKVEEKEG
ncbi:hypothetical protein M2336_001650 [Sphingobium sp. B1D7B]|uniref:hypothetical protein n=1 Tax=Sphingobium sp. B1D7B TaxID=2940578 RepID=UPI0022254D8F|nr:hypothetical protein [Sphingobium sp. B1D7B]MCW2405021.1 hypothetical protein [Sphingobium sp. B1D7B]